MKIRHQLPPIAAHYVEIFPYDKRKVRHVVGRFHVWLDVNHVSLREITPGHVDRFMQMPWSHALAGSTKNLYQTLLHRYVRWLGDSGYAKAFKKKLATAPLPKTAQQFISELQATLSRGTIDVYKQLLRQWHRWADANNVELQRLTRNDVVAFSRMLQNRGLALQTRGQYLARLRRYLFYLSDQGLLKENPSHLICASDFPKPPSLLPRALPPHVDAELCSRLAASSNVRCRGLLLMRRTGLRVGELANLPFHCLHENHQGHPYLKVPLGKLKKERLVPLNDEALSLLRELQEQGRAGRDWLIENPRTKEPFSTVRFRSSLQSQLSGLPKEDGLAITSHRLRHSFATELLGAGLGLAAIKQLLGHRSMNMTLRYVSLTPNQLRDEYLAANAKARKQYGNVPEPPPRTAESSDGITSAAALADIVRKVRRDATTLAEDRKPQARRAARQLNNIAVLLEDLGI